MAISVLFLTCLSGSLSQAQVPQVPWSLIETTTPREPYANALFDLAEQHYPAIFTGHQSTVILDGYSTMGWEWSWIYRYYPVTKTYLALQSLDYSVYMSGPSFGPDFIKAGYYFDLMKLFPSGIIRPGSNRCVNIGSPEPGIAAFYRGIEDFESTEDYIVSWESGENGGIEVTRHAGSFPDHLHFYTEKEHIITAGGLRYLASSSRTYTGQDPEMDQVEPVPYVKSKESVYQAPGLLLGPSSRYCLGQSWLSAPVAKTVNYTYDPGSIAGSKQTESALTETLFSVNYVIGVNIPVTVRAGTFNTVAIWTNNTAHFIDVETGILVAGTEHIRDALDSRIESWRWKYRHEQELYAIESSGMCPVELCGNN
ncbi:MAG: hypothetical protein R3F41_12010 [Gammaproteobacteria bacterium]|nr:hypothetical protein [Pseudomonadales bacterium]MCP5348820.1 hypothetical protein [Pseudomonadales bacterium]